MKSQEPLARQSQLKARIFDIKTFYRHLKIVVSHYKELRNSRKRDNVNKEFSEKIMLAVTQVNGCRYCNYLHTKNLIDEGASDTDIKSLLNGELGEIGNDESTALMFAEHYADTGAYYDVKTYHKFLLHYGKEKASDILATIRVIMVGNIHGISIDALQSRFKGQKMKESKFINEIGIFLGIIIFIPATILQVWFEKLFERESKTVKKTTDTIQFETLKIN